MELYLDYQLSFSLMVLISFLATIGPASARNRSEFTWFESPVIVGGTQGSGTRGVEQALHDLGVYMHPKKGSKLWKKCYNGSPMDNMCMNSHSNPVSYGISKISSDRRYPYWKWLNDGRCVTPTMDSFEDNENGKLFLKSIPEGWKLPENMFNVDLYAAKYPNFIFVHVVRDPLDMASAWIKHLVSVTNEFSILHGGDAEAALVMEERCGAIIASHTPARNVTTASSTDVEASLQFTRSMRECAVSPLALAKMANYGACVGHTNDCNPELTPPSAWSCLHMMLWAEMNRAVHQFGSNCLEPKNRYLLWHAADNYALRERAELRELENAITDVLGFKSHAVETMFQSMASTALEEKKHSLQSERVRRRLGFNKYLSGPDFDIDQATQCAEAAEPGTLALFGFRHGTS